MDRANVCFDAGSGHRASDKPCTLNAASERSCLTRNQSQAGADRVLDHGIGVG